ncbi:MAG: PIN domain-containing protein [Spirochaetaceae bacterium]|nr:PIN domain-containing protein [Spirochaetaceae bacterium]
MTLSYFDSSMVLAILLEEARKKEAYEYWQNSSIRVSSILLRIETVVSLRRTYEYYKNKLDDNWLIEKLKILDEYLNEVNYRIIGTKIEREIYLKKELSKCRSLDAIHIATALKFREMTNVDIVLYTFDKTMHELAEHYRFKTNKL